MADAITTLRADHRSVEALFKSFEKAGSGAVKTKQRVVGSIIEELSVHAFIEERVFYPAVREHAADLTGDVLEALEEHHIVKWVLSELQGMDPSDERFDAKVTVLMENVRHHVKEEEGELFPEVRKAMGRKQLVELGTALDAAKTNAPKKPHPRAPDEPPLNAPLFAATADSVSDGVSMVVDRAAAALKKVAAKKR